MIRVVNAAFLTRITLGRAVRPNGISKTESLAFL
jgi:hypothetical protein